MIRTRWHLGLALTALCAAGCGSLPVPGPKPPEEEESGSGGESFAGRWTIDFPKEDGGPLVLDVTDDGSKVAGARVSGDGYSEYSLDLAHQRDGSLKGTARFALPELPGKSFDNAWVVTRKGEGLQVECDNMEIDLDTGEVFGRSKGKMTVVLAPAAAAAPPAAPAMDMSAYVVALPTYKHLLAADIAVGQWIEMETKSEMQGVPPQPAMKMRTAVVAESGDAWVLEVDCQAGQKDLLLAVFVDKSSGRALKAFVGNRGQKAKEKEVPPLPEEQPMPEGSDVEVTVEAGTFPARLVEQNGFKSWTGREGDAEGVMLKTEHSSGGDELKQLEAGASFSAGGTDFPVKHLVYTSGSEWWVAKQGEGAPLNTLMLRMLTKTAQMTSDTQLVGTGSDAKPEMDYPR